LVVVGILAGRKQILIFPHLIKMLRCVGSGQKLGDIFCYLVWGWNLALKKKRVDEIGVEQHGVVTKLCFMVTNGWSSETVWKPAGRVLGVYSFYSSTTIIF
jgi:hypothetical protein